MAGLPLNQFDRLMAIIKQDDVFMVPLGNGVFSAIDAADRPVVSGYNWKLSSRGYAIAKKDAKVVMLHRLLMGLGDVKRPFVDHVDGDPLNNQRYNLRTCTHAENMRNRNSVSGVSRFKGVSFANGSWRARINCNRKRVSLGCYSTEAKAAKAYDKAAIELHGPFAKTNEELGLF